MSEKDIDKLIDEWAEKKIEAAPELRPTEEVYQRVKARKKRTWFAWFPMPVRWAAVGLVLAALVLVVVLRFDLFYQSFDYGQPVGIRKGFIGEKGGPRRGPKKGPKREAVFSRLQLQYHKQGMELLNIIDPLIKEDEEITLTSEDNYRLLLLLDQERYIYIFQVSSGQALIQLFPNDQYSPGQNPVKHRSPLTVPSSPNWFYLDKKKGEENIYIIASVRSLSGLDELYTRYASAKKKREKLMILSNLLDEFTSIQKARGEEAVLYLLSLQHD